MIGIRRRVVTTVGVAGKVANVGVALLVQVTQVRPDDGQASQVLELLEVGEDVDAPDVAVPDDDLDDAVGQLEHRRLAHRAVVDDDGVRVEVGRRVVLEKEVPRLVDVLAVELKARAAEVRDELEPTGRSDSGRSF